MVGLYVLATGELRSVGTAPPTIPDGMAARALPEGATYGVTHEWDAATAEWVPKGPVLTTQLSPGDFMRPLGEREVLLHRIRLDPSADLTLRSQVEWLHSWLLRVSRSYVDLDDPITAQGVALIVQVLDGAGVVPEGAAALTAAMMAPREVSE
jgi:hypothetical protein